MVISRKAAKNIETVLLSSEAMTAIWPIGNLRRKLHLSHRAKPVSDWLPVRTRPRRAREEPSPSQHSTGWQEPSRQHSQCARESGRAQGSPFLFILSTNYATDFILYICSVRHSSLQAPATTTGLFPPSSTINDRDLRPGCGLDAASNGQEEGIRLPSYSWTIHTTRWCF